MTLVGRTTELAALTDAVARASAGHGGVTVLKGEPGTGKSSLLEEVARSVGDGLVLRARGVMSETILPFAGIHQLLFPVRRLIAQLPEVQAQALRAALGLGAPVGTDSYVVSVATLTVISEAAGDRAVLVVVDDLQWIDPASREALLFVSRRLANEPVAMVLAVRDDDWAEVGDPDLPAIPLGGLSEDSAAALLQVESRSPVHVDVARRLTDATGGNPLALVEAARAMASEQLAGQEPLPPHLPVSTNIERAFSAQLSELTDEERGAILVAAADGTGSLDVVEGAARALGLPDPCFGGLLDKRLLVTRDGLLDFRHPILRSLVYARAGVEERRRVHRALAGVMERRDASRALWHRVAAASGPDETLVASLRDLAGRDRARGAHAEAMAALEKAAELTPQQSEAVALLVASASAAWAAGRLERAIGLLDRADALSAGDPHPDAMWIRGGIELAAGDASRACRTLVDAAGAWAAIDPERALVILNLAAEAASLANDPDATVALGSQALRVPDVPGERAAALRAAILGFAADFGGDIATARTYLREAVDLSLQGADPTVQLTAGRAAIYIGDDEAARTLHAAVLDDARRRGTVDLLPIAAPRLATAEVQLGLWSSAAVTAEEASRIADETGQLLLAPHGRACLAILAAARGNAEAMEQYIDEALRGVRGRPMGLIEDDAKWARGLLALGDGRAQAAVDHLADISHPVVQLLAGLDRLEAGAATGDPRAADWAAAIEPLASDGGPTWAVARLHYGRALLTDDTAEAVSHFETAVAAGSRRPFEQARVQLAFGRFLRRHRHRVDARGHLRAAATTFVALEAEPWAAQAHAELRATGETIRPAQQTSVARLTAQELQVARVVAEGLGNREVAARLFLSPRTVEFHLRNVFAKLDISSRSQLARVALEDPAAQEPLREVAKTR